MIRVLATVSVLALSIAAAHAQSNRRTLNNSVSITAGNTFQTVLPVGTPWSITIENNNTNGDNCWVYIGATASATKGAAILLQPGGSYTRYYPYIPSDNIAATCATTADTLYVDTQ